ncbi:tetratricopeptide repeat protein [uncultured Aquabacterium sp.]|uniref:O-linked N-acetylglucosamine transferase, SPINDLY family protein n=1 Tax=Aquabacterium sp. TaxID=1872578 RepID=UPI0025E049E4|nr:tetratricopeptide repeat protein [uncultured Aquabacterium sp.]
MSSIGRASGNLKAAHAHWEQARHASKKGDWQSALNGFKKAHQLVPSDVLYAINLARAHRELTQLDEAVELLRGVLAKDPEQALARSLLGECLAQQGDSAAAAACLLEQLPQQLHNLDYLEGLSLTLFNARRYPECIQVCLQALGVRVDHAQSHYLLGVSLNELGNKQQAIECFKTALALDYENGTGTLHSLIALTERELCQWDEAQQHLESLRAYLRDLPSDAVAWVSVFALATLDPDPQMTLVGAKACSRFIARHAKPLPARDTPVGQGGKLRIGFVSADFHQHATSILMAELVELMDKERFEVTLYSHGPIDNDDMHARIRRAADHFVDLRLVGDALAARRIREDQIDILIDVKGHTSGSRLAIFAYRPAPIQVTWLAFPGTTGATYIDYFIGDAIASPASEAQHYTEKLALMPQCYQPNDRRRALPGVTSRSEHGLPDGALVLCGFNQPFKLSGEVFDSWCRILQSVPRAVLWLLAWNDSMADAVRSEASRRGIDPSRLVFAPKVSFEQHISRFALADVFLDSWPCNGHTTVSDALWAGVPVVTYRGRTFASRVAASLLHNVGMPDMVCESVSEYEQAVLRLCHGPQLRASLRDKLVAARSTAPLFDSVQYAQQFGALLERMADRHRSGLAPDHLT